MEVTLTRPRVFVGESDETKPKKTDTLSRENSCGFSKEKKKSCELFLSNQMFLYCPNHTTVFTQTLWTSQRNPKYRFSSYEK